MSKTKSEWVKVEYTSHGNWGVVGKYSRFIYDGGSRFYCCWSLANSCDEYEYEEQCWKDQHDSEMQTLEEQQESVDNLGG